MRDNPQDTDRKPAAIVVGASGGIATALINELLLKGYRVFAISRQTAPEDSGVESAMHWLTSDYSVASIASICSELKTMELPVEYVFVCNGVLHQDTMMPEKSLSDFSLDQCEKLFRSNTLIPMAWLKGLSEILRNQGRCVMAVFSARVGSISDNRLGGWYSYRGSKAALNMMLKTAAIELARRAKNIKLIAFHPGTVDTELSKPFQRNVPADKLFTPTFVARQLFAICEQAVLDGELSYLDWDAKSIEF